MSQLLQFYKSFQQARLPAAKTAPTFEDLTIDDKLTEHQRVVRYAKSTIGLQRLVHVKMIADVSQNIGFADTVATIIPLLEPLSKDEEPVIKQHLVEQLKRVAQLCFREGGQEGYRILLEKLLPIASHLLEDEKQEVRQSASSTIVEIAQLVKNEDIGQHILTIILRLAHEDDKEEMRMTAAQLLNLLAESLGQDLCKQFVIPEMVSLAEDPVFRVRKSTALNFYSICKVGGEHELLERLMPAFVRLSKDDMYRVRRACAESLTEISKNVSEDIRLGVLVEIFLRLAHDPSKLVKQSILQQSGMFIATLPQRAVNETILSQYCSMAANPTGDVAIDAELCHICAYSFPAVLQIIGKERWRDLKDIYMSLAQSRSPNIKQTLAHSLHEIARILEDGDLIELELVPVFEDMIQDVEIVRIGVIKHLAAFLRTLPGLCRNSYLPVLHEVLHSSNPFNWRLRQHLADQLPELVALPSKSDVYRTLFPTVMTLLQDPVVSVRTLTFKGVSAMLNAVYDVVRNVEGAYSAEEVATNKKNLAEINRSIANLITSDKCQMRQLVMELCVQLLKDIPLELFEEFYLPGVLMLTCDRVLNVRLAVAMFLVGWAPEFPDPWEVSSLSGRGKESPWKWLLTRSDIRACVERLKCEDRDVFLHVSKLKPIFPDIEFSAISVRGRKEPPGGSTPVAIDPSPVANCGLGKSPGVPSIPEISHSRSSFSEHLSSRDRSGSSVSFRGSFVEEDSFNRLQRLSLSSKDDDEDVVRSATSDDNHIDYVDASFEEREFVASVLHNAAVEEELDIIDGIKSPFHGDHIFFSDQARMESPFSLDTDSSANIPSSSALEQQNPAVHNGEAIPSPQYS